MIKINLKKVAKLLGQTGIGGGTTYACYAKAGLSEEQSIGAGVGAFVLSGIAFDTIFPDDNGQEKLWKKLKRCKNSEDLENLVDELADDDDEDEDDEDEEEADVTDNKDSLQECGESDPTEETIVSSTTDEESSDWSEQELEEFGNIFTETFSNALDNLLENRPISIEKLTETLDFDENGESVSDNGIHWQIPVHDHIKPSNKKERRAKNMRRNNALLKQYNKQRRKEFEAGMHSDSEASAI